MIKRIEKRRQELDNQLKKLQSELDILQTRLWATQGAIAVCDEFLSDEKDASDVGAAEKYDADNPAPMVPEV